VNLGVFVLRKKKKWDRLVNAAGSIAPGLVRLIHQARVAADGECSPKDEAPNGLARPALLERTIVTICGTNRKAEQRSSVNAWIAAMALIIAFTLGFGRPAHGQVPCHYEVAHIIQAPPCPITGPPPTMGQDISPNGRYVVGHYDHCSISGRSKGFLFDTQTGQFTTLPFPANVISIECYGVNDSAKVCGQLIRTNPSQYQGFVWDSVTNQYTILPPHPGGAWASANAINNSGQVCGFRSIGSKGDPVNPYEAFIWSAQRGFTDLGLINGQTTSATNINEQGQVCGWTGAGFNLQSFFCSAGSMTVFGPVPNGTYSDARAVNNAGLVVAGGNSAVGYLWDGRFLPLPTLNADYNTCSLNALNDIRGAAGSCRIGTTQNVKPIIWANQSPRDLSVLTTPVANLILDYAGDITNGWVVRCGAHYGARNVVVILRPVFPRLGDTDCNSVINIDDLIRVINQWGPCPSCDADVNGDSLVNIDDLLTVITHWTN
jgi:hypothetical protein